MTRMDATNDMNDLHPPTAPSSASPEQIDDLCRVRMGALRGESLEVVVPGTDYRLQLRLEGDPSALPEPGKRLRGVIAGNALRMHRAVAGGRFIEPVMGHPRIVQGTVMAIEPAANRMLADAVVPMWLTLDPGQSVREFATGDLVNFYCQSGMRFTPMA